jgi:hypothetical protein
MPGSTKLALFFLAMMLASPVGAAENAPRKMSYGSRAGMQVTVISMDGLDTSRAVIKTKHTRNDAIAFCREYVGKVTDACIEEELATPLRDSVTADCAKREFTNFFGESYRFEGINPKQRRGLEVPDFRLRNLKTGELADGSMASGYPVNMEIFSTLCPSGMRNGSSQASTAKVTRGGRPVSPKELDQIRGRYAHDVNFPKQFAGRLLTVTGTAAATNPRSPFRAKIEMPQRGGEDVAAWCLTTNEATPVGTAVLATGILFESVYSHDEGGEAFYLKDCILKPAG